MIIFSLAHQSKLFLLFHSNKCKNLLHLFFRIDYDDNTINECLIAIKNYNIALEIKKLEKEIRDEVSLERQMELMDQILALKTKEGKTW